MQNEQITQQEEFALRVAYERCSFDMRQAVGSYEQALQNEPVKLCMTIMAREEGKHGR